MVLIFLKFAGIWKGHWITFQKYQALAPWAFLIFDPGGVMYRREFNSAYYHICKVPHFAIANKWGEVFHSKSKTHHFRIRFSLTTNKKLITPLTCLLVLWHCKKLFFFIVVFIISNDFLFYNCYIVTLFFAIWFNNCRFDKKKLLSTLPFTRLTKLLQLLSMGCFDLKTELVKQILKIYHFTPTNKIDKNTYNYTLSVLLSVVEITRPL